MSGRLHRLSTLACRGCSPTWNSPTVTVASRACFVPWSSRLVDPRRLGPERLTANQRRDLMEIVEDRHGNGSTLITSQLPRDKWHDVIGDPTFATAILDRIVHNAYRLELDGPSMRKLQATEQAETEARSSAKEAARTVTSPTKPGKRGPEMTAVHNFPPAPVGQQGPPARAAAPAVRALRVRRAAPPIDYRDGLSTVLDQPPGGWHHNRIIQRRRLHPRLHWSRIRRNGWSQSSELRRQLTQALWMLAQATKPASSKPEELVEAVRIANA